MVRASKRKCRAPCGAARSSRRILDDRPSLPVEATPTKAVFCQAFAQFIRESSALATEPFFFLISGNHKKGLFYQTMLDVGSYSAMLLGCGLVRAKHMGDGKVTVMSSLTAWEDFLKRYHLDKDGDDHSEISKGEFNLGALLEKNNGNGKVDSHH